MEMFWFLVRRIENGYLYHFFGKSVTRKYVKKTATVPLKMWVLMSVFKGLTLLKK